LFITLPVAQGRACGTYKGEQICIQVLTGKPKGKTTKMLFSQNTIYSIKVRDHMEDLHLNGRIKLQWILKK